MLFQLVIHHFGTMKTNYQKAILLVVRVLGINSIKSLQSTQVFDEFCIALNQMNCSITWKEWSVCKDELFMYVCSTLKCELCQGNNSMSKV